MNDRIGQADRGVATMQEEREEPPGSLSSGVGATRFAGDEMAGCLERFLAATADERTLERSRDALALWSRLRQPLPPRRP